MGLTIGLNVYNKDRVYARRLTGCWLFQLSVPLAKGNAIPNLLY